MATAAPVPADVPSASAESGAAGPALLALARAHGVDSVREGPDGRAAVPGDTLVAVLAALDVDASTPDAAARALDALHRRTAARLLPRVVVTRTGQPHDLTVPVDAEVWIEFSDGHPPRSLDHRPATGRIPGDLPPGRHTLCARRNGRASAAPLLVAPARLPGVRQRSWGFLAQLYSVLSQHSWGMGDLGDLADLAQWAGHAHGAGFVQVNPLHAGLPATPGDVTDPSPYRPSSRRFADPVHLRVEAVPEFPYLDAAARDRVHELARHGAALRDAVLLSDGLVDRDATWTLKHEALTLLHQVRRSPGREAAYQAFLHREGAGLDAYATWCALAEAHGPAWRSWPAGLRDPGSAAVRRAAAELAGRVEFHRWLAWLVDDQLAAAQAAARGAGMRVGLIHDLAVGCHPEGADAWALQNCLATGISVGAPPDAFNARGQDWGLPPWRPDALADAAYEPYAALLRGVVRHAGALRIDHVMGLFRLWWVPEGRPPTEGTYVRYDHEAMLGVLALEAERAGAAVIGEDLGTVEPGVREQLADRGILGTSVLWFERDYSDDAKGTPLPPEQWREQCLATLTTHDLPSTASRLSGEHVELRHRLGLLTRPLAEEQADAESDVEEWLGELAGEGLLSVSPYGDGPAADLADPAEGGAAPEAVAALHRYLLRTPARLLGVWLPDTLGDPRPQNLPGTSTEYPNWRLPVADAQGRPVSLEQITASPRTGALTAVMNEKPAPAPHTVEAEGEQGPAYS
ncbi:4-alpha-glucanotransferase [Streptacidiphilus carbonis]|uniref:4-alpha-glucanotransferase n=1 Tax=Streptacidiphilus carbonis TaxID=105422 RepID=UPI000B051283|nr:4-alpha-glucanotransferase [Streptacidiphilus carbonis]